MDHIGDIIKAPTFDTSGGKCAICHALSNRTPGACVFVNIDSRLAKDGVCEQHRITDETRIEFIPAWGNSSKQEMERKYPGSLIYYTENYDKANVKKPVPEYRV